MGVKITRAKTLPIGVDMGTTFVRLAQLRSHEQDVQLVAACSSQLPPQARKDQHSRLEFLAPTLRSLVKSGRFSGRQAVLALPSEMIFVHNLKLPRLAAPETIHAVRTELAGKLPYPVEQAVVRHVVAGDVLGDGEARQEVIAVSAQRSVLESYLEMAQEARLDVVGINITPCAVVECFARLFRRAADASRTVLFLDLGASNTQVALSHGSKLAFARSVGIGADRFDQAAATGLNVEPGQARAMRMDLQRQAETSEAADALYRFLDAPTDLLVEEITQCLRYYESVFRNQAVERVIFIGGQAYDKRLCQSIAQRLNLPAQIGDPLVRVKRLEGAGLCLGLDRREPQPDWAVAVGLSLGYQAA